MPSRCCGTGAAIFSGSGPRPAWAWGAFRSNNSAKPAAWQAWAKASCSGRQVGRGKRRTVMGPCGPWSASKSFRRQQKVIWAENNCTENNIHVSVGKENYLISGDGYLMPVRKDQGPPDVRYFPTPR